jgi:hypothetical protein
MHFVELTMSFDSRRHDYHGMLGKSHPKCWDVHYLFRQTAARKDEEVVDANLVSGTAQGFEVA